MHSRTISQFNAWGHASQQEKINARTVDTTELEDVEDRYIRMRVL